MPTFSDNDWHTKHIPIWEKSLASFKGLPLDVIEIGCYEGRSALWLLDNILTHPDSKITCVDIFSSTQELKGTDWATVKKNFLANIEPYKGKVALVEEDSKVYLKRRWERADIIYIDGSHLASDALIDSVQAHMLLKHNGIIIFDDYLWHELARFPFTPKSAFDAFMECFGSEYRVVSIGYQVLLQKI